MKILLAIDGSDFSQLAVDELARMTLSSESKVHILNVYQDPLLATHGAASFGGNLGGFYEEALSYARTRAENIVSDAAKSLKDKHDALTITTAAVEGIPKNVILEQAQSFGADLIVVGSQGQGALTRFMLGSVSQSVAMHADCSVLIVRKRR